MNLNIHLHDPEIVSFMDQFPEDQHGQIVTAALRAWMAAHHSARGLVEKLNLQELHEWELEKLQTALGSFQTSFLGDFEVDGSLSKEMKTVLAEFFSADSEKGLVKHFDQRIEARDKQMLTAQQELNDKIIALLAGSKATAEADASSPKKGIKFEDAFAEWIQQNFCAPNPLIASHVGTTNGSMGKKVGDIVMRSTSDHALKGRSIVLEAKSDRSYTLEKAREEMARCKRNRDASAGIFVFDKSIAPKEISLFHREGSDIYTVWHPDNEVMNAYVEASISVVVALLTLGEKTLTDGSAQADITAIQKVIAGIESHLQDLSEMGKQVKTIRGSADKLDATIHKLSQQLNQEQSALDAVVESLWDSPDQSSYTQVAS